MDQIERLNYLRSYLGSPIWQDIHHPELLKRLDAVLKQAVHGRASSSEGVIRGLLAEAAVIDWMLTRHQKEIEEFDLTVEREEAAIREQEAQEMATDRLMRYGRNSPYLVDEPVTPATEGSE